MYELVWPYKASDSNCWVSSRRSVREVAMIWEIVERRYGRVVRRVWRDDG